MNDHDYFDDNDRKRYARLNQQLRRQLNDLKGVRLLDMFTDVPLGRINQEDIDDARGYVYFVRSMPARERLFNPLQDRQLGSVRNILKQVYHEWKFVVTDASPKTDYQSHSPLFVYKQARGMYREKARKQLTERERAELEAYGYAVEILAICGFLQINLNTVSKRRLYVAHCICDPCLLNRYPRDSQDHYLIVTKAFEGWVNGTDDELFYEYIANQNGSQWYELLCNYKRF